MLSLIFLTVIIIVFLGLVYWLFMSPYSQLFGAYPWRVKTKEKIIAVTFDDGPNEPYTSEIVDFLNLKGVKATFFQVGKCVERYPKTTRKIIASGHVIGNHSLSHSFHKYFSTPCFEKEIIDNQAILQKYIGQKPALFRSPWLWRQPCLLNTLKKHNLQPVSGEFCHSLEVLQINSQKIAKAALKKATYGSIIIFHDGYEAKGGNRAETVQAAKIVVEELIKADYRFVTVDQLLGVPAYQP